MEKIKKLAKEIDPTTALHVFLYHEAQFRLRAFHGVKEPSEELVEEVSTELLNDEYIFDMDYVDNKIEKLI